MHRVAQEKMSAVESCAGFTRRGKHGGNFLLLKALWAPGWYQATFRFLSPKSRSAFQLRKMPLMRILILISLTKAHINLYLHFRPSLIQHDLSKFKNRRVFRRKSMVEQWLATVGAVRRRCCVTITDEASSVVAQGPTVIAVGADVGCLDIFFSLIISLKILFSRAVKPRDNQQTNQSVLSAIRSVAAQWVARLPLILNVASSNSNSTASVSVS